MDIESISRKAINIIKESWGLPKAGFIAGGSISNIIWELVSGNKAIVNDIDVFIFDGILDKESSAEILASGKKMSYVDKDLVCYEDYGGINFKVTPKEYYTIDESTRDGIYNYIRYRSSIDDPSIVINSFDINCTTIGYSIEEDKFYWLKSFEDFLNTGELKVCNLNTPCHTAIRIFKKQDELNAKIDEFEQSLITYCIPNRFLDTNKTKFSTRYSEMFDRYKDKMPNYIKERCEESEVFLLTKGIDIELYTLGIKNSPEDFQDILSEFRPSQFYDSNISKIFSSKHFLFYMRNIYNNSDLKKIWEKTSYFFTTEDYIDVTIVDSASIERLARLTDYAPNTIENLRGHRLSEQLAFVDRLFDKFKEDPIIGISILEKFKLEDIDLDDDSSLLILELTVRKRILNDVDMKVSNILNNSDIDNVSNWF